MGTLTRPVARADTIINILNLHTGLLESKTHALPCAVRTVRTGPSVPIGIKFTIDHNDGFECSLTRHPLRQ